MQPERVFTGDSSLRVRKPRGPGPGERRTDSSLFSSSRAAYAVFGCVELLALLLRLRWARGSWFSVDDWDFLTERQAGNFGDLFRPHWQHWVTLPTLAYRLLWWLAGLNYLPYQLLAIVSHLVAAALLVAVMRRAGVGPWVATAAASVFVFIGAGMENIFFSSTIAFSLTQLLLADHDGPVSRRDWLGLGAGLAALCCSGVALPMTIAVGAAMLVRRGWRIAVLQTAPLAGVYLLWLLTAPPSEHSVGRASNPIDVVRFALVGLRASFGRLGQVQGFGIVLAGVLVGGLILIYAERGTALLRGPAAVPIALLVGALVFLVLTGVARSPSVPNLFGNAGVADAGGASRYTYVVAAMTLPAIALAGAAIIAHWRPFAIVAAGLLVVGVPGHIHRLSNDAQASARVGGNKYLVLSAPRLPLANQLPRSLLIGSSFFGGPTLGWLLDNLPSGRIPAPPPRTRNEIATQTLQLALAPHEGVAPNSSCSTFTKPAHHVLRKGATLTLRTGSAAVVYLPQGGGRSRPAPLKAGRSVVALAGPLNLLILPPQPIQQMAVEICQ